MVEECTPLSVRSDQQTTPRLTHCTICLGPIHLPRLHLACPAHLQAHNQMPRLPPFRLDGCQETLIPANSEQYQLQSVQSIEAATNVGLPQSSSWSEAKAPSNMVTCKGPCT